MIRVLSIIFQWGTDCMTLDLPCTSALDLSRVYFLPIPDKPIIWPNKIFLIELNSSYCLHTVKASRPVPWGFKRAANLSPRFKSLIDDLGTRSIESWTIWFLRPVILRTSALLLSKTYLCEPGNWYLCHSLITKPFVRVWDRKIGVMFMRHRARPLPDYVS